MIAEFLNWLLVAAGRLLARPRNAAGCVAPCIYVANHTSHLDALLLLSALPAPLRPHTRPVASEEYWNAGPLRSYLIRAVFRGVLVARRVGLENPLEPAAEALRQGDSLIFFPEGTRGSGQSLQPLKPGIYHLARWFPHIDIVPVWIEGSHRSLPKGFAIPLPRRCPVTFGAPLRITESQTQDEFLAAVRTAMERLRGD